MSFTNYYNNLKNDENNISNWFPKIQNCGMKVPETFITAVPEDVVKAFFMEDVKEDMKTVYEYVTEKLLPSLPRSLQGLIFLKNGCFSNKFDFKTCAIKANPMELTNSLIEINYDSFMFGTGGNTELAIRKRIPYIPEETPCIYNGMPLRNEYRVFYDFDKRKALYIVNYWDWDYCYTSIARNATDKIIYESVYPTLQEHYEKEKDSVMRIVTEHMKSVDMNGIWSVDIMEDENGDFWLIDMAVAQCSAYWNPQKITTDN